MIPALRMLRRHWPEAELHVLVASEAAPFLQGLDWIDRVWSLPRTRGKIRLGDSWPTLRELRRLKFDRSVDFVGNDRGAIVSRLIGAKERLGVLAPKGFAGRKLCYTTVVDEMDQTRHEVVRDAWVLSGWDVPYREDETTIRLAPPPESAEANALVPAGTILCHLSTSQPRKEWPAANWAELDRRLRAAGHATAFTSGPSEREQELLKALAAVAPQAVILPRFGSLGAFAAAVARARIFVSPDTAPLHLAAGLGVPTLGLFGPTASSRWAPLGERNRHLQGGLCPCSPHARVCAQDKRCIDTISVHQVVETVMEMLAQ
ncbi:glycosyltransferase family 9 protein [Ruficoccus amylovorans]|uniref:Glycosyltransferase family 9 protein n=1 Tax=Ruficoccus amylovorans TaxID=1804625 RepID=A0A842HH32_9BACT|nr:glycosyltransferase family 9 protein [Ruficoccus amylovorans]MBC2594857.1 glycosyltransferase family 9 protein [Ruficoccus amylovorans]